MKWRGAYVATKFAMEGLTEVLRIEMSDTPIKIILIEPGPITSKIRENAIPHFEKWINWEASPRRAQYETSQKADHWAFHHAKRCYIPSNAKGNTMLSDPLFILVVIAVLIVLGILLLGVGTFGKGGEFNRKYANKIMRWRIGAQFVAVVLILLYVYLRGN